MFITIVHPSTNTISQHDFDIDRDTIGYIEEAMLDAHSGIDAEVSTIYQLAKFVANMDNGNAQFEDYYINKYPSF